MTLLSCRQYDTRMYVAMMIDAYINIVGSPVERRMFEKCNPGNTFTRHIGWDIPTNARTVNWNGITTPMHPYSAIWYTIETQHRLFDWNALADYELDLMWQRAQKFGLTINGVNIPARSFIDARSRWQSYGWLRYEYKRSKRRSALAPFLRVAAIA